MRLGRYRLVEPLGAGAFATVWRAWDDELAVEVAVKVLAENWCLDSDVRGRFLAEARLLRRISSDVVVKVHDVGEIEGRPYFVMDLISGGTITDLGPEIDPRERLRLAIDCARAAHEVHGAGVVHRDIKPSNILIDGSSGGPRVVMSDLGTAKALADGTGFTMTAGTPAYMAPEQALGGRIDERCDVYSIAVVTYELLAGRLPHQPDVYVGDRSAPAPIAAALGLPGAVDTTLRSALSTDPRRRPTDAATFADMLERDLDAQASSGLQWPVWLVVVLGALLLLGGAALGWWWT